MKMNIFQMIIKNTPFLFIIYNFNELKVLVILPEVSLAHLTMRIHCIWPTDHAIDHISIQLNRVPAAVAEWVERLCSEQEIPCSNPGILPLLSSACRELDGLPCRIHAYTVYTPIGGKGRCLTRRDLWDHRTQARKECRREIHSGFETREEGHMKSKTGAISGSTNWALVQQKI